MCADEESRPSTLRWRTTRRLRVRRSGPALPQTLSRPTVDTDRATPQSISTTHAFAHGVRTGIAFTHQPSIMRLRKLLQIRLWMLLVLMGVTGVTLSGVVKIRLRYQRQHAALAAPQRQGAACAHGRTAGEMVGLRRWQGAVLRRDPSQLSGSLAGFTGGSVASETTTCSTWQVFQNCVAYRSKARM